MGRRVRRARGGEVHRVRLEVLLQVLQRDKVPGCLSIYPSIYVYIYLYTYLSIFLSIHLFIYLSVPICYCSGSLFTRSAKMSEFMAYLLQEGLILLITIKEKYFSKVYIAQTINKFSLLLLLRLKQQPLRKGVTELRHGILILIS